MNANVIIKKASDGTTRLNAQIGVGSKRNYMLMEHDYLTLKFSTDTPTLLHLGDYVEIENVGRYELTAPTRGELNKSTGGYDYEIRLDAQYWKFKNKLCKFLPQIGSNETNWTYTDTLPNHAQQILFNIRALAYKRDDDGKETLMSDRKNFLYNGKTDWSIEWDDSVDATKAVTIQYDSKNIIDAIAEIAEAYECEWWFEQNVLHFGKCEYGTTPVKLEMGNELVAISRSDSKETYATRIYAYGSDRNIASNYRKALVFDAEVANGLLHDPARELEVRYFRASDIGIRKGKADTQCVLDFAPVSTLERNFKYRTNTASETGLQSGAFHLFKPDGHAGDEYDFDMTGERKSMKSGMFEWSWLPMEKPYLVLSTFRLTVTPTALNKVTDAITPKYLTAFFRLAVDYYDVDGQTKRTAYHTIMAKGAWQGINKPIVFKFEDQYLAIPTEKVIRVVIENGSQIDFAIWYDESGNNYGYVYDNKPTISVKIDADGQIGLFEGWPEFSASGITIEVLDKVTGEVDHTITGATFNAGFDKSQRKLTLPGGASINNGDKYRLPQLNTAMVPARYFTSIYSVFEKYQDITTNGIVNSRLLLPEVDEDGNPIKGYLDAFDFESEEEAVEDVVIFEDVCPSRISKITSVQQSDEYTEEQPEQDGSKTQINYREYIITDDLFSDANQFNRGGYLIDGAALRVTFQSGLLNGMTFDVDLLEDNYHFQIKRDDATKLPNEIIKPKPGDEFILHGFNIAMISDSKTDYVSNAEKELLRKTREYIDKLNTDTSTYQCTVACDLAYEVERDSPDGLYLGIGRSVNIIHPGYFKNGRISRVLGYEIPLDFAYDNPVYFIGEKAKYSRIGAIEDRLDGIGNTTGNFGAVLGGGGTAGSGSGGASPYVIQQIDSTPPTDRNVYSALRARLEFALKTIAQTIKHVWTFLKGIRIGTFIAGQSGAQIDAAGNAEVESLHVRSWLKVQELIYNRLNAQEGDTSFGDVGTIEQITNNSDGMQTALMRMRWEGDFTAFQPGDVVYGYVNKLDRADAKEFYKAWAWVKSVDRAANQLVLATYPDSETPAGKNHPMTEGMVISRWGNNIEPSLQTYINPAYSAVIGKRGDTYINKRQRTFFISCDSGNLVELMGVNKPKLEPGNYGTILGIIPDGLLDEKTEELINKDQPYLFARGIIVQDLIRVGYEGVTTRTANYRGMWSALTAASATDYYRSTPGMYDTVTWNGALWQCVATQTLEEPSDASAAWVKMTASLDDGKEVRIWTINPSANIVSVRKNEVRPERLSASVTLNSSDNATQLFTNNYDLLLAGAKIFYSTDGVTWQEFIIGQEEPLDLEDETGVIELEDSTDNDSILTVGGNDISTADIGDRIYFELRDATTADVLASTQVPVVKDGQDGADGIDGRDGLMVYPAGYYDPNTTYTATSETAPVVMYADNYYVLKRGKTYKGASQDSNLNTPALDIANNTQANARWQRFDKFNAIFADIVMAEFAKLGSAVIYGDWMISQQGTRNGAESTEYQYFKNGSFEPNYAVNFKTGELKAYGCKIQGGEIGIGNNKFKIDENGISYGDISSWALNTGDKMLLSPKIFRLQNQDEDIANAFCRAAFGQYADPNSDYQFGTVGYIYRLDASDNTTKAMQAAMKILSLTRYGYGVALQTQGAIIADGIICEKPSVINFTGTSGIQILNLDPAGSGSFVVSTTVADFPARLASFYTMRYRLGLTPTAPLFAQLKVHVMRGSKTFKVTAAEGEAIYNGAASSATSVITLEAGKIYKFTAISNGTTNYWIVSNDLL